MIVVFQLNRSIKLFIQSCKFTFYKVFNACSAVNSLRKEKNKTFWTQEWLHAEKRAMRLSPDRSRIQGKGAINLQGNYTSIFRVNFGEGFVVIFNQLVLTGERAEKLKIYDQNVNTWLRDSTKNWLICEWAFGIINTTGRWQSLNFTILLHLHASSTNGFKNGEGQYSNNIFL